MTLPQLRQFAAAEGRRLERLEVLQQMTLMQGIQSAFYEDKSKELIERMRRTFNVK